MARTPERSLLLRPADPFDLIRWLARSQSDPRKAVAELVQNSIDAHARSVAIERRRLRGGPALVVRDDGEGVLPTLGREEALRFIATNIGASRKRNLSASPRTPDARDPKCVEIAHANEATCPAVVVFRHETPDFAHPG